MIKTISTLFFFMICMIVAGCGGGGGGGTAAPASVTTKAKTTLRTSGLTTSGYVVTSLDIIISIPYGVTVELDPVTKQPSKNVVQLIGIIDPAMVINTLDYVPATASSKGTLRIVYINAVGFTPSDSLLVQLDITTGFFPKAADFSLQKFEITTMTLDGKTITPPTAVLSPIFTATVI